MSDDQKYRPTTIRLSPVKARTAITAMMERGILTLPAGATVLRLLPPLTITEEDMEHVTQTLISVLGDLS